MRHPQLGVVEPAAFIPHMSERLLPALSQFVIAQALADWRYFLAEQRPLDLSINLPISFLEDPKSFDYLCRQLPDDPAFAGQRHHARPRGGTRFRQTSEITQGRHLG